MFARPSYQNGVVHGGSGRAYPDVALDADPTTGMLVGETQIFPKGVKYDEYRIGGTSLASPLMAGVVADTAQHASSRLGFLNIAIYKLAAAHVGAFTDVTPVAGANVRPDFANGVDKFNGYLYSIRTFNQDWPGARAVPGHHRGPGRPAQRVSRGSRAEATAIPSPAAHRRTARSVPTAAGRSSRSPRRASTS